LRRCQAARRRAASGRRRALVAGNTQGGRFAVIYPEILQGHSIAMAVTMGRLAGKNAALAV